MTKLNLLLLEDDTHQANEIKTIFERSGMGFKVTLAKGKAEFANAINDFSYDVILAGHIHSQDGIMDAIKLLNDKGLNTPFIIITSPVSEEYAISLMKAGAFNYVLKDRIERLPNAILNAVEKYNLNTEREKVLNDILPREAMMKEAEKLAHFGSWKQDMVNNTTWWSDELYRILGYEPGEVQASQEHFMSNIHPEDIDFVNLMTEDAINNYNKRTYTFRVVDKQGALKYIEAEIFITRGAGDKVTQVNGFLRDMTEHVDAEIRSLENEEKYRSLFEHNPSALCVMDTETRKFLDVNIASVNQYGYSREELLTMNVYDILCADDIERLNELDKQEPNGLNSKKIWKARKKDGTEIYAEVTSSDIVFDGKKCRLVLSNDITEKLATINQLKESEARLITSQRIANIGSWEVDLEDENSSRWTDETYRIFGLEPGNLRISSDFFRSLVHPDDHWIIDQAYNNALEGDGIYSAEFRIIRNDGTERTVYEVGEIVTDPETGKKTKLTGTAHDITERKQAKELLQQSEANLRSIFENTDTAYVLLDMNLCVLSFNQPAFKFSVSHLEKELSIGSYIVNYFSDTKQAVVRKSVKDARAGMDLSYEVSYPDHNGYEKWYYAHFHPVWSPEKNILGVIMSLRDITERKMSELQEKKITSELIQRNKDLEQFAYIISHNLRAPVANIIGISDALSDDTFDEDEKVIFMDGLHDSAKKLDNVITDLNRILQLKNGVNENKEKVQFSHLVNDIKFSIGGIGGNDMFQVKCDFTEIDEMITLKSYMHSIFYNLISNSLKYKKPDLAPVVEITSRKYGNTIELIFKDNGIGIDMVKNGDLVFGLYKRFNQHVAEGKGMGLFMVKTQVETIGGKISVKSEVNEGTEFRIELENIEIE